MSEDIFVKLSTITQLSLFDSPDDARAMQIAQHRAWLKNIRHERPNTATKYRVAVYIRFFNQTRYENYLDLHIKSFRDTLALCPMWELVDIYVDEGATPPNMETAKEWSRLLNDIKSKGITLIITQKISNISHKMTEAILCARLLARRNPPVGLYFISEDLFTLSSYYLSDIRDTFFLPTPDWTALSDDFDDDADDGVKLLGGESND